MRSIYFSFHYEDIWRVNQVRNSNTLIGPRSAGFADRSLWEEAKRKDSEALRHLILSGLDGTTVTAVLIGSQTASRRWVRYEIEQSIERGNAILGVHINALGDRKGQTARRGRVPALLTEIKAPIYTWTNAQDFGKWSEDAWQDQCNGGGDTMRKAGKFISRLLK